MRLSKGQRMHAAIVDTTSCQQSPSTIRKFGVSADQGFCLMSIPFSPFNFLSQELSYLNPMKIRATELEKLNQQGSCRNIEFEPGKLVMGLTSGMMLRSRVQWCRRNVRWLGLWPFPKAVHPPHQIPCARCSAECWIHFGDLLVFTSLRHY